MPTYVFTGKVLPERAAVSITLPRVHTFVPEPKLEFDAVVRITLSQVSVVVKTTEQTDDLPTLRNYVDDAVRIALDSYGYLEGRGYELEITSVVSPSGDALTVFGVEIPEIHQSKSERPSTFNEVWEILTDPDSPAEKRNALRHALADLRQSHKIPF